MIRTTFARVGAYGISADNMTERKAAHTARPGAFYAVRQKHQNTDAIFVQYST